MSLQCLCNEPRKSQHIFEWTQQTKEEWHTFLSVFTVCMSCSIDSTTEKGLQLPIIHLRLTISKKMKENVAAEKEILYDFWERCYQTFTAIIENIFFSHTFVTFTIINFCWFVVVFFSFIIWLWLRFTFTVKNKYSSHLWHISKLWLRLHSTGNDLLESSSDIFFYLLGMLSLWNDIWWFLLWTWMYTHWHYFLEIFKLSLMSFLSLLKLLFFVWIFV